MSNNAFGAGGEWGLANQIGKESKIYAVPGNDVRNLGVGAISKTDA